MAGKRKPSDEQEEAKKRLRTESSSKHDNDKEDDDRDPLLPISRKEKAPAAVPNKEKSDKEQPISAKASWIDLMGKRCEAWATNIYQDGSVIIFYLNVICWLIF